MAIGVGFHCWYCEHGPCTGDCREEPNVQPSKVLKIESQIMQGTDVYMLRLILKLAREAGYTHIKDNWGPGEYDGLTIDEAQSKFGKI
jgi:hypothetical protein